MKRDEAAAKGAAPRRRVAIERVYDATIDDVWEMWTTKDGIESWWGPGGFAVTVQKLELVPAGVLEYTMRAVGKDEVAYMKAHGMPTETAHRATFQEVAPKSRLVYDHLVDFVPGLEPYLVTHTVELSATGRGVRMLLTFDAMHDDEWTTRAKMGWESELQKLEQQLSART